MDILYFVFLLAIIALSIYFGYKFFDCEGLYYLLIVFILSSYILSFKLVNILGIDFNISIVVNVGIFSIIYILLEREKKNERKKIIEMTIVSIIFSLIIYLFMTFYVQSINDTVSINIKTLFLNNYKILLIYPITLLIGELSLIFSYDILKKETNNIFVISIILGLSIKIIEIILFTSVGYLFILKTEEIARLSLTNYVINILLVIIFAFLLKYILKNKKVKL